MIALKHDAASDFAPDAYTVDRMADAGLAAMQRTAIPDLTTASEVLSASLLLVDRMLSAVRDAQDERDRFDNARIIATALNELLATHGKVPS